MATETDRFVSTAKNKLYREQIITTDDQREFKIELLDDLKRLLKEFSGQPTKKWLKSYEVRKILAISPGTLQNLRVNGTLPYTKIGDDHKVIYKLLVYTIRDKENADRMNLSLRKGIMLTGPVSCGKTSLMNLFRFLQPQSSRHVMKSCQL